MLSSKTLLSLLLLSAFFVSALQSGAETDEATGYALVTSRQGDGLWHEGANVKLHAWPRLHSRVALSDVRIQSGADGQLVLVLSNRVALGVGAETDLHFGHFGQMPFSVGSSRQLEPSASRLHASLSQGQLAIVTGELRVNSEFQLELPQGVLNLGSGAFTIDVSETEVMVRVLEGNARFQPKGEGTREFIPAQTRFHYSRTAGSQRSALSQELAPPLELDTLADAARFARTRVQLLPPANGTAQPELRLVLPAVDANPNIAQPYRPPASF